MDFLYKQEVTFEIALEGGLEPQFPQLVCPILKDAHIYSNTHSAATIAAKLHKTR